MSTLTLHFTLASDALFGRGDGVAGVVDQEVQYDVYGCPYLGGKTLKGMLVNECADILNAVPADKRTRWQSVALQLFGEPGGTYAGTAKMQVGDACLPEELRAAVAQTVDSQKLSRSEILDSLTALRQQTAIDPVTGTPLEKSLRTTRVIVRSTPFVASLWLQEAVDNADSRRLLAACVKAFRRAGTMRNRGFGRLRDVSLSAEDGTVLTEGAFEEFCKEVLS
ncbi:MAG: hypothetical protein U0175_21005 [Caldilineaceae bacterium]